MPPEGGAHHQSEIPNLAAGVWAFGVVLGSGHRPATPFIWR